MRLHVLIFLLAIFEIHAQEEFLPTQNIADCAGAVEIQNQINYKIAFSGKSGNVQDFYSYPSLVNIKETNSLFFKFSAPHSGKLSFEAKTNEPKFQLVIFKNESDNIATDIFNGKAPILRIVKTSIKELAFPSDSTDNSESFTVNLETDDIIIMVFNTEKNLTDILNLTLNFEANEEIENSDKNKKVIDERKNNQLATMEIQIRDAETGFPVIGEISIKDKKKANLYKGSDLLFSTEKTNQITIKCHATGYLFVEEVFKVHPDSSKLILIELQSIGRGKSIKIDKLQFVKGTDNIYPGSEAKLIRIKDFLLLNADIQIEIQGHVNNEGENDMSSRKLSRQRAKRVRNFFTKSGVNGKRLSVKACSNKFPIYPNPKNEKESQANRRVEIKIL
jgi:outer membrane protein OmpA-like peptidoglycan-associated protein